MDPSTLIPGSLLDAPELQKALRMLRTVSEDRRFGCYWPVHTAFAMSASTADTTVVRLDDSTMDDLLEAKRLLERQQSQKDLEPFKLKLSL